MCCIKNTKYKASRDHGRPARYYPLMHQHQRQHRQKHRTQHEGAEQTNAEEGYAR